MIAARATAAQVRRAYDAYSYFYGLLLAPLHRATSRVMLERARIGPHDRILEVAIGPATSFDQSCRRTNAAAIGLDLSGKMLRAAARKLRRRGIPNAALAQADARSMPFRDGCFDVVLSGHFLDLLPAKEIDRVVGEFYRVLKPGGRLVLANMSKPEDQGRSSWERLYGLLPASLSAYLLGACRPVFTVSAVREQGFINVQREYCRGMIRSEVVSASKPSPESA